MKANGGAKVIHVASSLSVGGLERVALELARRGRAEGRDDRLIVFDTAFRDPERDFHPGDVPVDLVQRGPGLDLAFARAMGERISALHATAVHAHNATALVYSALALRGTRRARPRLVATFHARPYQRTLGAWLATRAAAARADAVTAVSADLRRFLRLRGWVGGCEVVGNGVDLERFRPGAGDGGWRRRLGVAPDAPLIVHIGRFDPRKRHADLLEAAAQLASRGCAAAVVCCGTGPELARLNGVLAAASNVKHVACVTDVPGLLGAAELLVLCSEEEAAPMVLLEALACGLPFVSTEVSGVRGLLAEAPEPVPGWLVPVRRPAALAAALERALAEVGRARGELRSSARALAERHGWARPWARYRELYGIQSRAHPPHPCQACAE